MAKGKGAARANGNTPPNSTSRKLYLFVAEDSGVTIPYRKVGPLLMAETAKALPRPKPPIIQADYGNGDTRAETNEADPAYKLEMDEWRSKRQEFAQRLLIERSAALELNEEQTAEVAVLRAYWKRETGQLLSGSDTLVYVQHLALGSQDDLQEYIEAVTRRSHPTEAAVDETLATFPGGVAGE